MHTTIGSQSHEVQFLALLLGIAVGSLHLWIFQYRPILAGTINLHEVLIDNTSGTDVEVSNLRVTHLAIRKTYILTTCL